MSAKVREVIPLQRWHCSWPQLFTTRRPFNHRSRETENRPFLEYMVRPSEGTDEDDSDEDDSNEDELEDKDDDIESFNDQSDVRRFMVGMLGEDDELESRDQVDLVANFCDKSKAETHARETTKHVALLDERCMENTITDKRGSYRPYLGPLTCEKLRDRLSRKRFRVDSDENLCADETEDKQPDAARRIVFITNLDSFAIEALATTVALTQAPALQNLFYKHLANSTSIGVTIKSHGFQTFSLEFNIPYYVLRKSKEPCGDIRKQSNGDPLRTLRELPPVSFLSMTTNSKSTSVNEHHYLYEATTSIVVTGSDHYIWAAYAFVDTYFDSRESADGYHEWKGQRRGRADPLAAGQINADDPIWDPREYFLKVIEIRTDLISMEWSQIINMLEAEHQQSRTNLFDTLLSNEPKVLARGKEGVKNFMEWNSKMTMLLRILGKKLSDTVAAWDTFRRSGIYYFDDDSVTLVEAAFERLKDHLRKLRNLERELGMDNPDGLNVIFSLESMEATNSQQITARQLGNLTVITIIFFPLALAANLFSTTGVLPFAPNLTTFIFVFLILAILILTTLVVLSNWRSWLHQVVECNQRAISFYKTRFVGEDAPIIPPKGPKPAMCLKRFRKPPTHEDLETGIKKD
ncbi:hypothetical protein BKA64DRAFT_463174 [Cadophora sp. MPI-SDFR-AT-0126]|nr:hypothetical protein BKA64DRAFT_463174 [Leotiomycetes sp. MPI-SDFR-AT-0126]